MAVFTYISELTIKKWVKKYYMIGDVIFFRGTTSGIENSNFFLTTTKGFYILTIFEKITEYNLPYYLKLMQHLALHHIPVPVPILRLDGKLFGLLAGKLATIVTRLPGQIQLKPRPEHCIEVGNMLAHAHIAGKSFNLKQHNLRSINWWISTIPKIRQYLNKSEIMLLDNELKIQQNFFYSKDYITLPGGPCHCDLFKDNVLFINKNNRYPFLSGFFDYYFAGNDKWLFDLAVTVNDWCIDLKNNNGLFNNKLLTALLKSYNNIRPILNQEAQYWSMMLRAAALRFWISRLYDFYKPRVANLLITHNPKKFELILRQHINNSAKYKFFI